MVLHRQAPRRISREYARELCSWEEDFTKAWCLPYLVETHFLQEIPDTAALMRGASQNVQDMSGSPATWKFKSSAGDNNNASGAVRSIRLWSIDSTHNHYIESASMHATSGATMVSTVKADNIRYLRHWAVEWGTADQDAAGSISVYDVSAATNRVGTIAPASNECEETLLILPKNWKLALPEITANMADQFTAGSAQAAKTVDRGGYIYYNWDDGECDSYDLNDTVGFTTAKGHIDHPFGHKTFRAGTGTCAIMQFYHRTTDPDINVDFAYTISAIIWLYAPAKATGQVPHIFNAGGFS